jgi:hypothetical protein
VTLRQGFENKQLIWKGEPRVTAGKWRVEQEGKVGVKDVLLIRLPLWETGVLLPENLKEQAKHDLG